MTLNTLFRVDSSSKIGTGHVMRCLAFAEKFDNVIFAVRDLEGNINRMIPYKKIVLNSNDITEFIETVKKNSIDIVIIDHYGIDYDFEKKLKENTNVKLIVIDDRYQKHYCDELINRNISADKKKYKNLVPIKCKIKTGKKFLLLKKDFHKAFKYAKKNTHFTVFVGFGGSDVKNLTLEVVKILNRFNVKITVVTTDSNPNLKRIKEYVKIRPWIKLYVNSNNVAMLIKQSSLGIISTSGFANEFYYLKVHFIGIKVADNQKNMYRFLKKNGFPVIDGYHRFEFLKILRKEIYDLRKRRNTRLFAGRDINRYGF